MESECFVRRIINDGRVTVPRHILKKLSIKEGDEARFTIQKSEKDTRNIII